MKLIEIELITNNNNNKNEKNENGNDGRPVMIIRRYGAAGN